MICTRFDLAITVVMVISTFSINFLAKLLCIYLMLWAMEVRGQLVGVSSLLHSVE